jgi:hypothetical protein
MRPSTRTERDVKGAIVNGNPGARIALDPAPAVGIRKIANENLKAKRRERPWT